MCFFTGKKGKGVFFYWRRRDRCMFCIGEEGKDVFWGGRRERCIFFEEAVKGVFLGKKKGKVYFLLEKKGRVYFLLEKKGKVYCFGRRRERYILCLAPPTPPHNNSKTTTTTTTTTTANKENSLFTFFPNILHHLFPALSHQVAEDFWTRERERDKRQKNLF